MSVDLLSAAGTALVNDPWIPDSGVSEVFPGVTVSQLRQQRHTGTGPRYTKFGRKVFYRLSDLIAYAEQHERTSTAEAIAG